MNETETPLLPFEEDEENHPTRCTDLNLRGDAALRRIKGLLMSRKSIARSHHCPYQLLQSAEESRKLEKQKKKHNDLVNQFLSNKSVFGPLKSHKDQGEDDDQELDRTIDSFSTDGSISTASNKEPNKETAANQTLFTMGNLFPPMDDPEVPAFWDEEAFLLSLISEGCIDDPPENDYGDVDSETLARIYAAEQTKPIAEDATDRIAKEGTWPSRKQTVGDATDKILKEDACPMLETMDQRLALDRGDCVDPTVARKRKCRYLRHEEEFQKLQQGVRFHKQRIAKQHRSIRTLRFNSKVSQKPLHRSFVAYHVATRGMIMFSIIREEEDEHKKSDENPEEVDVDELAQKVSQQTRWEI